VAVTLIVQDRPVVGLTTRLIDAARRCGESGGCLQLLTPDTTQLTLPASDLLRCRNAHWVVRSGSAHFDGHTGQRMRWNGDGFVLSGPEPPDGVPDGLFVVDVAVFHATPPELGGVLEVCVDWLAGGVVTGWGTAEPVTQRWSRNNLTEFCQERAPEPTKVVVVGGTAAVPVLGTLTAARVPTGLLEHIRIGVPAPARRANPLITRLTAHYDVRLVLTTRPRGDSSDLG
jgi:uncharacterized protein DUF6177